MSVGVLPNAFNTWPRTTEDNDVEVQSNVLHGWLAVGGGGGGGQ